MSINLSGVQEWDEELAEEYQDKCDAIIGWAEGDDAPESFDDSFVVEMGEKIAEDEELTPGQRQAIDNIIDKFSIEV